MKPRIIFILLLIFSFISSLSGERFKKLNEDLGLSNRRCFSISQDKNGLIWIATKLSIDRYDGHQITHYDLISSDQQPADNIGFNFVALAPDSTIWAYTQSGSIYKYDEQSDAFKFVYSIRSYFDSYNIILNHLYFESNNKAILATSNGILVVDIQQQTAVSSDVMQGTEVYHILKQQELYYFSTKTGLYIVRSLQKNKSKLIQHLFVNQFVNHVFYDSKHQQFWIGTFSNGLYILPKREGSGISGIAQKFTKPIRDIIPYSETQVAVGVDGEGVFIINRQTLQTEKFFIQSESTPGSIGGNSIWDLHLDRQKILWIATYHEGVSYTDVSYLNFRGFKHEERNNNSIASNYINAVLEDKDGDLWFGTNNGISLLYRKSGTWKHFFQGKNLSDRNVILTLCEDVDEKVWAGGYAFGAAVIDKRTEKATRLQAGDKNPVVGTDYIYSIYKDEFSGNLWIGGLYGKISAYNPKTKQSRIYNDESSLRCFSSCNDSTVVLGLYRGFYLLNRFTGEKRPTRLNGTINHILKDGDGTYWVSTMTNGLYYYDLKTDSLARFTRESHGLSSNHIYAAVKDEEGFLWISTEEGVNKFSPKTAAIINYDKQDGLISNQFIANSWARCSTSEIIFGSADGALIFYPSDIKKNKQEDYYQLLFSGFQLFGNTVRAGEKDSPLKYSINKTKKIVLPYNKNYFTLSFTLPNFQSSDKTKYSFYLEDYDLGWSTPSNINTASYSKIQPGKYTFFVRAYIDRELQEERQMVIIVRQPWWNTVPAWIIYILMLISASYYAYRYLSEKNKKKQTQEKMEFFINTAHDLLTPLSLIEAPLKDISFIDSLSEEAKYLLSLALNNTRKLSHFVHQLIDFQKITLNTNHLVVRKDNLYNFLQNKANNYRPIAAQKFISLYLHLADPEKEIYFDREKINKILDNLLSNAIKYTPFGGKIEIVVFFHDNEWSFTVKDNGIGIPQKNQNLIFRYIFRAENDINNQNVGSGVGLKMVNALVRIHKGRITFTSKKGEGTAFTITLPYQYDEQSIDSSSSTVSSGDFISQEEKIETRIFVMASNPEMVSYLQNTFSKEYYVDSFTSGKDAYNQIDRLHPNLIIADSSLIDMDGYSFARRLKDNAETSHIPVIMLLDKSDEATIRKALVNGATDYIKKPFEPEVVKLQVANLLSLQQTWKMRALADIRKSNITAINNDRDQEFMDNLIQLIEQNLDNPDLNISMLCKELALSRTLLYNKITQLTGNSPNEFIRIIRLKNAANLLISGKYTVTEVASMVGIDNQKYFSRIFKDYYKVSPKNYLKEV